MYELQPFVGESFAFIVFYYFCGLCCGLVAVKRKSWKLVKSLLVFKGEEGFGLWCDEIEKSSCAEKNSRSFVDCSFFHST